MRDIAVRPARAGDLADLLALYAELADGRTPPAEGPEAARLLDQILRDTARTLLVATAGGRVAGTADLAVVANLTHRGRPWATVENVVVARSLRGGGVGSALLERAVALARAAGCYKIQLMSRKERVDAHRFYRRLGFEPAAEGFRLHLAD